MKTTISAVFMALFTVLTVGAFGDSFYSVAGGYHRFDEQFPEEDYGRDVEGGDFLIMLNYYPEEVPIGWFIRTSFGGNLTGLEWKGRTMSQIDTYGSSEIQISAGPSYRLKLGRIIHLPISLGPVFSIIREEGYSYADDYSSFLSSLNLGLLLDVSLIINPFKAFSIVNGLYTSFDFLHWERGFMSGKFRTINSGKFDFKQYTGFKVGFYLGVGLHFD